MSNVKGQKRYDSKGKALRTGEFQEPGGTYRFKYKTATGKRASVSATTLDELREKEKQVLTDTWAGIDTTGRQKKLNDIFEIWKSTKRGLKDNVKSNYIYLYTKFVQGDIGTRPITELKKSDVKAFYIRLHDEKGLQVNTIDAVHTVLHQVLQVAVDDDIIRYNPSDGCLKDLKHEHPKEKKKALTPDEQRRFMDFLYEGLNSKFFDWYPIFATFLWTGMRVAELTGLTWADVDYDNRIIHVNHNLIYYPTTDRKQVYRINTTKTVAAFRDIPLSGKAIQGIRLQMDYRRHHPCNQTVDGFSDFVFVNRFGRVFNQESLNRALRERIIPQANAEAMAINAKLRPGEKPVPLLPNFSCHTLRHTFCTNLCMAGVNPKIIMDVMGHTDIQTTMNIYADVTKDRKIEEMTTLEEYIRTH